MTLVSVVVPTHNRPEYLAEALASVRAQTFTDYEIIVVSNGESAEMRARSLDAATSFAVRFFALPEGNLPAARNFGIDQAKGEWIAFLDDDDLWLPNKLERQLSVANASRADFIASDFIFFWPDGREEIGSRRVPEGWSFHKAACHNKWGALPAAIIVRTTALREIGGFDPNQRFNEDDDLCRRIAERHTIIQMDEALARYRQHASTMTRDRPSRNLYELRHMGKMLRDTPADLRSALPSLPSLLLPACRCALRVILPYWFRHPRKQFAALLRG